MPERSAGILIYRDTEEGLEVLLVHPGGPLWRNKDIGAWQMPKGAVETGEDDETAARLEVAEELGVTINEPLLTLGEIRQAGGKNVIAFASRGNVDPATIVSNLVEVAWPPRSGRTIWVPEVDEARWFPTQAAEMYMLPSQAPLIGRLTQLVSSTLGPRDLAPAAH
jgi:predicted NUDIX family NTP pyrophosphohydrolase